MDLRKFLEKLYEKGELRRIEEEIHWSIQAGALCAMTNRVGGPALHFKKVTGYPADYTMAGSLFSGPGTLYIHKRLSWGRLACALDLDHKIEYKALMEELLKRWKAPIKSIRIKKGTCKEEILSTDQVDLFKFPIPQLYEGNGGRFGTGSIMIAKDPDSGWECWTYCNWMAITKDKLTAKIPENSPLKRIYGKYEKANNPMPFCIVMGGDPATLFASMLRYREGEDVAAIAGGFRVDPIAMVQSETNSFLLPADVEIVIEGIVLPHKRVEMGPFPDYVQAQKKSMEPLFLVKAITHRRDPIFPFIVEGAKVSDTQLLNSIFASMILMDKCRETAYPVKWIYFPVEMLLQACVISTVVPRRGFLFQLSRFLLAQNIGFSPDILIFVDTDLYPANVDMLMNDWFQKAHPLNNYRRLRNMPLGPSVNHLSFEERALGVGTKLLIDATYPVEWEAHEKPKRTSFEDSFPLEMQENIIKNWYSYGFNVDPRWYR